MIASAKKLDALCEKYGIPTLTEEVELCQRPGADEVRELSADDFGETVNGHRLDDAVTKLQSHWSLPDYRLSLEDYQDGGKRDPFSEEGQPGTPITGGIIQVEPTAKYSPYQVRGYAGMHALYEKYYRQEPILFEGINEGNNLFAAGRVKFHTPDVRPSQRSTAVEFTEWCQRWWSQMWRGPQYFQRHLGAAKIFGFYPFEIVWGADERGRVYPTKFAPREPSTVDRWIMTPRGDELQAVTFQVLPVTSGSRTKIRPQSWGKTRSGLTRYTLTAGGPLLTDSKILVANVLARANNFEGISYIRPNLHWIKFKQVLAQIAAITAQKYGVPVPVVQQDMVAGDQQYSPGQVDARAALEAVTSIEATDGAAVVMPAGVNVQMVGAQGTMPNIRTLFEYADSMIERPLASEAAGLSSGTVGSYALASVLDNRHLRAQPGFAAEVLQPVNWLVRDIARYHGITLDDYPTVEWVMDGFADASKWIEDATKAMGGAPMWDWPDEMRKQALYKLDLDPSTFDGFAAPEEVAPVQGFQLSADESPHAVVMVGMPASGKSTYRRDHFSNYTSISMDDIGSRSREMEIFEDAIGARKNLVVDNTNATTEHRARYLGLLNDAGYEVDCYYFECDKTQALARNRNRDDSVPSVAIHTIAKNLEPPTTDEGFRDVVVINQTTELAPVRYDDLDFTAPQGARDAAQQGLDYRSEYGRGGTETGIARARDIARGANLSPDTVRRMHNFFSRHQQNRVPPTEDTHADGGPTNGWIAWQLWGGDAGQTWASSMVERMNIRDERDNSSTCSCCDGKHKPQRAMWVRLMQGRIDNSGGDPADYELQATIPPKDSRGLDPVETAKQLDVYKRRLSERLNPIVSDMQRDWRRFVRDGNLEMPEAESFMRDTYRPRIEAAFMAEQFEIVNRSKVSMLRDYGFAVARDATLPSRQQIDPALRASIQATSAEIVNRQIGYMMDELVDAINVDPTAPVGGVPKLKKSTIAKAAGGVVNRAWTMGRIDIMEIARDLNPEAPRIKARYSSMMDDRRCDTCASLDFEAGDRPAVHFVGSDAYYRDMPPGPCEGGDDMCRCVYIYDIPVDYADTFEEMASGDFVMPPAQVR